mgnify:CR=1 FL=1
MPYYRRNDEDMRDEPKYREDKRSWDDKRDWDDEKEWEDEEEEMRRPKKEQKKHPCFFDEKKCKVECPFKIVVTLVPIEEHRRDKKCFD